MNPLAPSLPLLPMPPLQVADIVLTHGKGYLSQIIAEATREDTGPVYSHASLIVRDGVRPLILEAVPPRVHVTQLAAVLSRSIAAVLLSPINLTLDDRLDICDAALEVEGCLYGYHRYFGFGLDAMLKADWCSRMFGVTKSFPVCSVLVGGAYALKGLDFGEPAHGVNPSEIGAFARTHPQFYTVRVLPCGPQSLVSP